MLLLQSFTGTEGISRLFKFEVELLSENRKIAFADIVGKAGHDYDLPRRRTPRYFNGLVSRFSQADADGNFFRYTAEIVPTLWFLDRSVNCRIFQEHSRPEIIEEFLQQSGLTDFKNTPCMDSFRHSNTACNIAKRIFNFISRLMEQYGIFYFFEHEETKHTLVLANAPSAHAYCPGQRSRASG